MAFPASNTYSEWLYAFDTQNLPAVPRKWTTSYKASIIHRCDSRIDVLDDRLSGVTQGRVMPDADQITIGSGRRFERLTILFLDVCAFSARDNWTAAEQKEILVIMNIFMAEMINIVRDFGGTFEKNTGDGLMAYFGEDGTSSQDAVKPAVEAATVMHYVNDKLISPWLKLRGIEPVKFKIGIDMGPVTIAHVGLPRGSERSIVAVGTTANVACKLMSLIPDGGICIGDSVKSSLPTNWDSSCILTKQNCGFVFRSNQTSYPAWELTHRLSQPV